MNSLELLPYEGLYFLHIPKTAGHFIESAILQPISEILKNQHISIEFSHTYWKSVNDNIYIITSFRDPVKRTVSFFAHYCTHINKNNTDNIITWCKKNINYISNYQSKSILFDKKINERKSYYLLDNENFLNIEIDSDKLYKRLSRINLIIKDIDLNNEKIPTIQNKILQDLKINIEDINLKKINTNYNDNSLSNDMYSNLSKSQIDFLTDINEHDYKIYNSDIFFKPGD